jgi:glycerophosphoryl diester phosphodiesterase
VLVAFHNKYLEESTQLNGRINDYNWEEIKGAYYTSIPFLNYPVITLDELFSRLPSDNPYTFSFDVKLFNGNEKVKLYNKRFLNAIIRLVIKYDMEDRVFIESVDMDFLKMVKKKKPAYSLFFYPPSFEIGLENAKKSNLSGLSISSDKITNEQVKMAHDDSLFVIIWSVKSSQENREAIQKNPDIIQTDKLENLIDLLK